MDWQQAAALVIVGLTGMAFLYARWRRTKSGPFGKAGGSCCHGAGHSNKPPTVVYKARKGQQPQVIYRKDAPSNDRSDEPQPKWSETT